MTLKELYEEGVYTLDESEIATPEIDAFYLLEHVLNIDRTHYLLDKNKTVDKDICEKYLALIEKRAGHVPYQYLVGEADFLGYKVRVNPDVLIPRLDTEVLCEKACSLISEGSRVLDMCTGSGCLAVVIKHQIPEADVTACDISEDALKVARENAENANVMIRFFKSDLFEKLADETFDVIVSNPPYVTEREYEELESEVKDHEPKLALIAGVDGLDIYRRLIPEAASHLRRGGFLIMEIGCTQAKSVTALMEAAGFEGINVIKDLAGLDRVILGNV